jgi:hypothetical protein
VSETKRIKFNAYNDIDNKRAGCCDYEKTNSHREAHW